MSLWESLAFVTVLVFAVMWISAVFSAYYHTEVHYDVVGALTHIVVSLNCLAWGNFVSGRREIQAYLVIVWAARLGLFLLNRILRDGCRDRRFDSVRNSPSFLFWVWTINGLWIMCNLVPSTIFHHRNMILSRFSERDLSTRELVGYLFWLIGFLVEVVADLQKKQWKEEPENRHKFINVGLWRLSRHPNFFGEILLWFGLYISASASFRGWDHLSVICPVFNYLLITKVTGIPALEDTGMRRWREDPEYHKYLENTPVLVPKLPWK